MLERGMTVMLLAHSQYRAVYTGMAAKLRTEFDAKVHLYTATVQEADYYRARQNDIFASITVAGDLYEGCREPVSNEGAVIDTARRNETELGITFNELALSDRHLGRGYALGGFKHPRSRISEETSYIQMLNGYNAAIEFWRRELDDKQPALLLNAPKVLCVLARTRDIAVRILTGSRYKNFYYWGRNEFRDNPDIERAYRGAVPVTEIALDAPYDSHLRFRARMQKQTSRIRTLRTILYMALRQAYWLVRGYEKAKGYYLKENIGLIWHRHLAVRQMVNTNLPGLDGFKTRPFAFFPLATEPETALQILSPEYFGQLQAIASVSRDLPAGAELVVKEHFAAAGRRPTDFYSQIREFKNVRLMNMAELGMKVARESRAIVTISGTAGFEGAVMGKPVIVFGRHNIYNFLPHVMVVNDEAQLRAYIDRAFSDKFDTAAAAQDGQRFLHALIETSFDLGSFQPIEPDRIAVTDLDAAYVKLLEDLGCKVPVTDLPRVSGAATN